VGHLVLSEVLKELDQQGTSPLLGALWGEDYEFVPVSPEVFFTCEYYMGGLTSGLHPKWLTELCYVLDPSNGVTEWVIKGAVGTGKTTVSTLAQLYKIYELCCIRDPSAYYGHLPGSEIVFAFFSVTLDKADVGYDELKSWLDAIPWFRDHAPRRRRPDDPIHIPSKNITILVGSLAEHVLGENVFGYCLDEANFFRKVPGKVVRPSDRTRAHQIYKQAKRRQQSRFMRFGRVPGLTCLLGSERTETEFLEEREGVAKGGSAGPDPSIRVTRFALWDVKPVSDYPSRKKFQVLVGREGVPSRVLDDDEVPPSGFEVLDVPVEHLGVFLEDTDEAIRDLAGRSVAAYGHFFTRTECVHSCVDHSRVHPFTCEVVSLLSSKDPDASLIPFLRPELLFHTERSRSVPIKDPHALRVGHVDIGLTGDPLGLAVGHETDLGGVYFDLVLRIVPPTIGEVDLSSIVEFFQYLRGRGFRFARVTYDQFQSKHSIQLLGKVGFEADKLSITLKEYKDLRSKVYAGPTACNYYWYPPLVEELVQLRKPLDGLSTPEHPEKGTDDIAQAVAGVVGNLTILRTQRRPRDTSRQRGVVVPVVGREVRFVKEGW
jgi:hypothetical protein